MFAPAPFASRMLVPALSATRFAVAFVRLITPSLIVPVMACPSMSWPPTVITASAAIVQFRPAEISTSPVVVVMSPVEACTASRPAISPTSPLVLVINAV